MDNADAFIFYAANGKLSKLQSLVLKSSSQQINEYITRNYFEAYQKACKYGDIDVMEYLENLSPQKKEFMIRSLRYTGYRNAAAAGKLDAIKHIEKQLPDKVLEMRTCITCDGLIKAFENNHEGTVHYLLEEPVCLAFADEHNTLCDVKLLSSFANKKIEDLMRLKEQFSVANPDEIFDLHSNEIRQYFYILRHLIRRNNPELAQKICFLLEIPSIRSAAYKGLTTNKPTELIQIAIQSNNDRAVSILMGIKEVRSITENNRVFQNVTNRGFDLKEYFQHQEFILKHLTEVQRSQLTKVSANYQNPMKNITINKWMVTIQDTLSDSYNTNPATLYVGGIKYKLPLKWDSFIRCQFNAYNFEMALDAYKAHTLHTAIRYLSVPNRWISMRADDTNCIVNNTKLRWSTFHELQPLIVLFWFICQKNYQRISMEYFSDAISKLGRVYNRGADGERDDWEGDKPADTLVAKLSLFIIIATMEEERAQIRFNAEKPSNAINRTNSYRLFKLIKENPNDRLTDSLSYQ